MRAAVLVALVALLGCASMAPQHPIHGAYIAAAAADNLTTRIALEEEGIVEGNPWLGDDPSYLRLVGLSIAAWVVFRGAETHLEGRLGRELRWYERLALWILPVVGHTYATVSNLRVIGGREGRDLQ